MDAGKRAVRYGMASATVPCMSLEAKVGPLCPAFHRYWMGGAGKNLKSARIA